MQDTLEILNKPGKLTDENFHHEKPFIYGMEITEQTPELSAKIPKIICQHHEKWNGSGCPLA